MLNYLREQQEFIQEVKQHPWFKSFKKYQSEEEVDIVKQLLFYSLIPIEWNIEYSSKSENHHQLCVKFSKVTKFYLETGPIHDILSIIELLDKKHELIEKIKNK